MNERKPPVGIAQLRVAGGRLGRALRSGVLPLFVLTCAVEAALLPLIAQTASGESGPIAGGFIGLAMLLLSLVDLVRLSAYAPLRRVALDGVHLGVADAFRESAGRMIPVFLLKQLIGIIVLAAAAIFLVLGVQMIAIPWAITTFALAPAIYLVAARDRNLVRALRDSLRIARDNLFAVFGIQSALLVLAVWLGQLVPQLVDTATSPFTATYALVAVVLTYRFAHFVGMSTLFLALDQSGHCE